MGSGIGIAYLKKNGIGIDKFDLKMELSKIGIDKTELTAG